MSEDEMDTIVAPLGLRLPTEARVLWGWHDGADIPRGYADDRYLGSYKEFLPLSNAADHYRTYRAMFEEDEEGPDFWWPPNQFTLTSQSSGETTFDCSVRDGAPSPIYFSLTHDRHPEQDFAVPSARSFGELVTLWIEAWDDGIWGYDEDTLQWTYEWERLDPARETAGLI